MFWLAQAAAQAANTNLLIVYLADFWPQATSPTARFLLITSLIGFLATINFFGVQAGTRVNNIFTVAKILPLLRSPSWAVPVVPGHGQAATAALAIPPGTWIKAVLVLFFGLGGFGIRSRSHE